MSSFKNITLLGKGLLGSAIVKQLVDAGFNVTVFSRTSQVTNDLPPGVKTVQVDYSSVDNLATALRGQDVVICTVGTPAISAQKTFIDAAIQAGVKRYVPSDWGALGTDPAAESLPSNAIWVDIQKYLKSKAALGQIEYNLFGVGPILEYVISSSFVVDFQNHTVDLYDGGVHRFSTTSFASIGKAVVGALKTPDATRNRLIRVHDIVLTQGKVLELAKKYSPSDVKWTENAVDASKELETILSTTKQSDLNFEKWVSLLRAAVFSGKFAAEYNPSDNELVGLPILDWKEFEEIFAANFGKSLTAELVKEGKFDGIEKRV
ncbi:hypothetical protein N7532_010500 [Penicillium argentinense]|uniref:NAD(P)-binding domain-containing protein n=1 Tax=Penicillium argentinense TaxID=1131581 RepID=A0A9W9EPW5_9EURO|nr:uncharacterized protein N7532_010500 [Penicillium argentinense]KAJ5085729.1 hypothetical protein N7532_010500 [Penicillium argentinense]